MDSGMNIKRAAGLFIALIVAGTWGYTLFFLLSLDIPEQPWLILPGIFLQTFLYTGLFITAHDAIHGTVIRRHPAVNRVVGAFCLFVYALFPYERVRRKHFLHHRFPASDRDPDYHDGRHRGFLSWYMHFLGNYITWWQIAGMAAVFNILHHLLFVPAANLILFWVIPSLLSTVQLFYFGTYLPHREKGTPLADRYRARSSGYGLLRSFLTCYHFGYHWEHHRFPDTPWWRLPGKRKTAAAEAGGK